MSDNFRVVECLYTPSDIFCIYDYTKIAYLTGNFICVREIFTSDVRPNFIKLDDHFVEEKENGRYIGLVSFPNLLVLGVKSQTRDVILNFFSVHEEHQLKVTSELAKKCQFDQEITYEMHQSFDLIYVIVRRDCDTEIIAVRSEQRQVVGRGFISGQISDFKIKTVQNLQLFSYYSKQAKQIVELQLLPIKNEENMLRIAQKKRISIDSKQINYCWCQQQLIVGDQNEVHVYLEGREMQVIRNLKAIKMVRSISGGFIVICGNGIRVYKKIASLFDFKGEYSLQMLPSSLIQLSPQQDLLAFYNDKNKAIYYSLNWEVSESISKTQQMQLYSIDLKKEKEIKTYKSSQALFAVTTGSNISIYSPVSYHCYLAMRANVREISNFKENKRMLRSSTLVSEKMLNQMGDGQPIETICIHPNRPIVALAFKNIIRIYFVLYNEFKVAKEIQLSHCKQIGFNNSGNVFYAKLGGKQGSKIYLYNSLSNFECIQILNTSRPVQEVIWTPTDTSVYAVYSGGYYSWSLFSFFKQRYDSTLALNFDIKGSQIYCNSLILWGERNIVQLDFQNNLLDSHKLSTSLELLLVQSGNVIFLTTDGFLYRCKSVGQIDATAVTPGFRVQRGSKVYRVKGNTLLCLNKEGHILCLQWGGEDKLGLFELVTIQRKKLIKFQETYQRYEQQIRQLHEQMQVRLQVLKEQFMVIDNQRKSQFQKEVADREMRYLEIRQEKIKVEEAMQQNMQIREQETLQYVKQLERIYERKIAIITNKLLTSEQLGFRNNLLAKQNLVDLEQKHSNDINKIRGEYGKALESQLNGFSDARQDVLNLKKDYQTRLAELELENQQLIKRFQNLNEANVVGLKKNVVNLQLKFSEAVSQKFNLQKNVQSERIMLEQLCSKNEFLSQRLSQQTRRADQLLKQTYRLQNLLIEKGQTINCLEERIVELQKSNEIFKYRIVEMKNVNDPKEQEILKLKDNMIELQEEYQKISKKAHQSEQTMSLLRKDNLQLKNALSAVRNRESKLDKSYATMTDRLRDITKSPIQEIRKMLLKLLEQYERPGDMKGKSQSKYHDSPLEQLNRAREHLEVCLKQAVDNSKKNQKQKETQIRRKNRENSQLLKQINDLRVKVVELETQIKDKQLLLQEYRREGKSTSAMKVHKQRSSTDFETEGGRNKTRQSFFQKSLFRGHWKEKRLKTEQGSRKKSTQSFVRNDTNHLYIESKSDQVDELRRVLDQKETIIKQLINKIHKLS